MDVPEVTETKFCFSTTGKEASHARGSMVEALEMSRRKCNELLPESSSKISKEDVAKFILIAIKHGGISNPENGDSDGVKESIRKLFPGKVVEQMYETAKLFSKTFQDKCGERGIYTGNPNATKLVPLRLKRLDPTMVSRYFTGDTAPSINPDPSLEKNSLTKLPLVKVQKSSCKTLDL